MGKCRVNFGNRRGQLRHWNGRAGSEDGILRHGSFTLRPHDCHHCKQRDLLAGAPVVVCFGGAFEACSRSRYLVHDGAEADTREVGVG